MLKKFFLILLTINLNAFYLPSNDQLPPGIAHCNDNMLIFAYKYWIINTKVKTVYGIFKTRDIARVMTRTKPRKNEYIIGYINPKTPYYEPAYWFMCAKMQTLPVNFGVDYPAQYGNVPLSYFADGIYKYFSTWIRKGYKKYFKECEVLFLNSIFSASGKTKDDVNNYLKKNLNDRKNYIITQILPNLKKAKKKYRIVAQWSAMFLSAHYLFQSDDDKNSNFYKNYLLILENVEKELRKTDFKVRGAPYYGAGYKNHPL